MIKSPLKKRITDLDLTIGSWVTIANSAIAELMSETGGFDWLVLDMEHSVIELTQAQELIQAIELHGTPALVRLTSNDRNQIKRVMDAGAHGVIVPFVNSAADAQHAVESVYYPPVGARGTGLARAQGYGASFQEYKSWLEENGVVIVMIESIDAVPVIDEILAVPGVDGFIIGPYDLSSSIGVPGQFDDPRVVEAIQTICESGKAAGIAGGIHVVEPDLNTLNKYIDDGFTFIGYGMDIRFLDTICRDHLNKLGRIQ
jgi:2-dehydro-3-deoxyglucarate aldolase